MLLSHVDKDRRTECLNARSERAENHRSSTPQVDINRIQNGQNRKAGWYCGLEKEKRREEPDATC
jgi:hypothetical protein